MHGAYAQTPLQYTARDIAMLPSYCKYTQHFRGIIPGGNNQAVVVGTAFAPLQIIVKDSFGNAEGAGVNVTFMALLREPAASSPTP